MKRRNVLVLKVIYISMVQCEACGEVGVKFRVVKVMLINPVDIMKIFDFVVANLNIILSHICMS